MHPESTAPIFGGVRIAQRTAVGTWLTKFATATGSAKPAKRFRMPIPLVRITGIARDVRKNTRPPRQTAQTTAVTVIARSTGASLRERDATITGGAPVAAVIMTSVKFAILTINGVARPANGRTPSAKPASIIGTVKVVTYGTP